MAALDTLAAYYVQQARKEKDKERRKDFFAQVRVVESLHDRQFMHIITLYGPHSFMHITLYRLNSFVFVLLI